MSITDNGNERKPYFPINQHLTTSNPALASAVITSANQQYQRLLREQGEHVFQSPRELAVAHETAHAIVGAHEGLTIKSTEVSEREKFGIKGCWGGTTWEATPYKFYLETSPINELLSRVRYTIAGFVGEECLLKHGDYRCAPPFEEIALAQSMCMILLQKRPTEFIGRKHASELYAQLVAQTSAIICKNSEVTLQLLDMLNERGRVRGPRLRKILARVQKIALDEVPYQDITIVDGTTEQVPHKRINGPSVNTNNNNGPAISSGNGADPAPSAGPTLPPMPMPILKNRPLINLLAEKLWGNPSAWDNKTVAFKGGQVVVDLVKHSWFDFQHNTGGTIRELMRRIENSKRKETIHTPSVIVRASEVPMEHQDCLWEGHLVCGAQELLSGLPDLGKSQVQISWVASATNRIPWPDGIVIEPCNVIMLTAEDNIAQTLVPRLTAAGADLNRVYIFKYIKTDEEERQFLLAEDLYKLEQDAKRISNVRLITIDPITAYMGGRTDSHKATEVRSQLGPLKDFAERLKMAVSTITHPAKGAGQRALDHFIASQAFIAASRIGHLVVPEMMEDPETGERVPTGRVLFTNVRNSGSRKMPTLAYEVKEEIFPPTLEHDLITTSRVVWAKERIDITADQAVAAAANKKPPDQQSRVQEFLRANLEGSEPKPQKEIMELAKCWGFTEKQLRLAREKLDIEAIKPDTASGWLWAWPKPKQ